MSSLTKPYHNPRMIAAVRNTIIALFSAFALLAASHGKVNINLLDQKNLVAWCIVPFDAKKRGPEERAQMLENLGITKLAYDWREKDIPTFDAEVDALRKHKIKLEAFWATVSADPARNKHLAPIFDLLKRRGEKAQIWLLLSPPADFASLDQDAKVKRAAEIILPVVRDSAAVGSKVALYNHGGWFGEPENQIAIIKAMGQKNVGIVYNFHHGHEHIERFPALMRTMQPYLLAVNFNGMNPAGPKILPIGKGTVETEMVRTVLESGWKGPIGILNHQEDVDAEVGLQRNLDGIVKLREQLGR